MNEKLQNENDRKNKDKNCPQEQSNVSKRLEYARNFSTDSGYMTST